MAFPEFDRYTNPSSDSQNGNFDTPDDKERILDEMDKESAILRRYWNFVTSNKNNRAILAGSAMATLITAPVSIGLINSFNLDYRIGLSGILIPPCIGCIHYGANKLIGSFLEGMIRDITGVADHLR